MFKIKYMISYKELMELNEIVIKRFWKQNNRKLTPTQKSIVNDTIVFIREYDNLKTSHPDAEKLRKLQVPLSKKRIRELKKLRKRIERENP